MEVNKKKREEFSRLLEKLAILRAHNNRAIELCEETEIPQHLRKQRINDELNKAKEVLKEVLAEFTFDFLPRYLGTIYRSSVPLPEKKKAIHKG